MKKEFTAKVTHEDGSQEQKKFYIKSPTQEGIKGAEKYRVKTWNQCLLDGILTKAQLKDILKTRKIWDDEKEQKEKDLGKQIFELEKQLFLGNGEKKKLSIAEGKKTVLEMRKLRNELREHISDRISLEENTVEALADNARFDFLVAECVFNEDGTRVYKDIEDYNSRSSDEVSMLGAATLAQILYQYDDKFEESLPENVWLKKLGLVNDKLELVDDQGNLVDQEGRKINNLGHYINDEGKRVDINGNLLNEDGSYVLQVEYEKESKKRAK